MYCENCGDKIQPDKPCETCTIAEINSTLREKLLRQLVVQCATDSLTGIVVLAMDGATSSILRDVARQVVAQYGTVATRELAETLLAAIEYRESANDGNVQD